MGMKNGLAFIVDTNLCLYEHQSTFNPNMPLRDLFYIAGEYQKLVDNRSLYSSIVQNTERICTIRSKSKRLYGRDGTDAEY